MCSSSTKTKTNINVQECIQLADCVWYYGVLGVPFSNIILGLILLVRGNCRFDGKSRCPLPDLRIWICGAMPDVVLTDVTSEVMIEEMNNNAFVRRAKMESLEYGHSI